MNQIFVNLKRFEVPRKQGGICPLENPYQWIQSVISEAAQMDLDKNKEIRLVYILPEGLIHSAVSALKEKGLIVPDDISIICFDDTDWSVLANPPLTVVRPLTNLFL